jgi:Leucine-rich repeat (LRR) protein
MPDEAYKLARRRIVNNALRRGQFSLDLSRKGLTELPSEIGKLRGLYELNLSNNQLTRLPPELFELSSLRNLILHNNELKELPPEIGQLTNLRYLGLAGNRLTGLPREIGQLTKLSDLDLSDNTLDLFPPDLWRLPSLFQLDLSGNGLTSLPSGLTQLKSLARLDFSRNKVTALSSDIERMRQIAGLDLSNNELSVLPIEIAQLENLTRLDLSGNKLTTLPREMGWIRSLEKAVDVDDEPRTQGIWLGSNPLDEPYPILIATGSQPTMTLNVLRWLRGELDPSNLPASKNHEPSQLEQPPSSLPEIPAQGYGPHFEVRDDGVITFAHPESLDRQGNNIARLKSLHPTLRTLSSGLADALGKGNIPHWHLRDRAHAYRTLVDQELEKIDFSLLYVEGVRLANAERAASDASELPALEPSVREAVDTLLQVHGAFILATLEGMEAIAAEERYRRTPQEEIEYRAAAVDFAQSLQNAPKVVDPKVATFVLGAVEEIGKGANLERTGTVATGTVKNVAITVSTAATLAAISAAAVASGSTALIVGAGATILVVGEGLKKSKPFATVAALVSKGLDRASETEVATALKSIREGFRPHLRFVLIAEPQLRRLAGQREELKWLIKSLDWIKKESPDNT